jgi:hypothetical protein
MVAFAVKLSADDCLLLADIVAKVILHLCSQEFRALDAAFK